MAERRTHVRFPLTVGAILLGIGLNLPLPGVAQTDYHNLDRGRPLRVEDAYATKQWAFELQFAPMELSQDRSGVLRFSPSLELKHGLFPGVETSVGIGLEGSRTESRTTASLGALELSVLANLWVEGPALPAAAIRVDGHLPLSGESADHLALHAILTRSLVGALRGHLNGGGSIGRGRPERWWVGAALDHTLPFRHTVLLVESWIAAPPAGEKLVRSAAGFRHQLSPTLVLDAGAGRGWTGETADSWFLTLGITHEFGVRALLPGGIR